MTRLDYPPVWLFAALILAFGMAAAVPVPELGPWSGPVGYVLIAAGVVLTAAAVVEMRRAGTTVVPHRDPTVLVTTGVFSISRNPIYLADVMFLAGFILIVGAALPLLLVPLLALVLRRRFIEPEEARIARAFGAEFERWSARTRRWI